jgi:hypothetical protein
MAHRQFTDARGVVWRVFETDPTAFPADWEHRAAMLHEEFLGGWLTFACSTETRRLAPIPPAWKEMLPEELGHLCGCAKSEVADTSDSISRGDCEGMTSAPSRQSRDGDGAEPREKRPELREGSSREGASDAGRL